MIAVPVSPRGKIVALCGGVGGAKLALGLARVLPPGRLVLVVNTGDDFRHLGLHVSPDIDTVLYTLAGLNNPETGWGRRGETWNFMAAIEGLGGETWFRLGDADLATHVERTRRLAAGEHLTAITRSFAERLGIAVELLPMSDDPVRTMVETDVGVLPFQHYFVRLRCSPKIRRIWFEGAEIARPNPVLMRLLADNSADAIVICPSNPFLSVDPILSMPHLRTALENTPAPIVAISPLIARQAVKGPTAKIMAELGLDPTPRAIVQHYRGLIDGLVIDDVDRDDARSLDLAAEVTRTLMTSLDDREALARRVLAFAARIGPRVGGRVAHAR
jgi:LPPG:FO 2-phospho-L-lactate transferase